MNMISGIIAMNMTVIGIKIPNVASIKYEYDIYPTASGMAVTNDSNNVKSICKLRFSK